MASTLAAGAPRRASFVLRAILAIAGLFAMIRAAAALSDAVAAGRRPAVEDARLLGLEMLIER
jgi:hypothetical protein